MGKKSKQANTKAASSTDSAPSSSAGAGAAKSPQKAAQAGGKPASPSEPVTSGPTSPKIKEAAEKIDGPLKRRKSVEEIQDAGLLKTEDDAEKRSQLAEQMSDKLESRPSQEDMMKDKEHIVNPTGASRRLSGALAATAKNLEKNITADKLDRRLSSRPDAEELEKKHVLNSTHVAPTLQGVQNKLQRQMSADELSHRLESRPEAQELKEHGVLKDGVAPSLQATQDKLQRQLNASRVSHQLSKRPSLDDLSSHGVMDKTDTEVAPSLAATAKKLERSLVQNHVAHLLESRPAKEDLVTHHILEDGEDEVSPVLQDAKHKLERQLKVDKISQQLRKRPSVSELEEKGIIDEGELGDLMLPSQKKCSLSRRARYTLALKAASRIAADNLISQEEKSRLKDLILSDDEKVIAAIECYEMDQDIEEMLDTLYRVAKLL